MDPRLLHYYNRELQHLREMGGEFAREFPKIAGRLGLDSFECSDPYVERLLEGFSYLAARVQLKLDAEFPNFTQHLLEMVYPHYLAPTPSMTVVQLQPDLTEGALSDGFVVPRGSAMRSELGEGQTPCEFRTAHDVTLWPLELAEARYFAGREPVEALDLPEFAKVKAGIRLRLRTTLPDLTIAQLPLQRLPLYLHGSDALPLHLYEQLLANALGLVALRPDQRPLRWREVLPSSRIDRLGFTEQEALLPYSPLSFQGYRLLHEYFAFPNRYRWVEFSGLERAVRRCDGPELELIVLLDRADPVLEKSFETAHLALYCAPAINLFPKRADRIHLSDKVAEHHVIPDRTRPLDFEIYRIDRVDGVGAGPEQEQHFAPFYAMDDVGNPATDRAFYTVRRLPRVVSSQQRRHGPRSSYVGSEVFVALVDANQAPYRSELRQLALNTLCTNRDLPLHMPVGKNTTDFTLETGAPVLAIRCLAGPTKPRPTYAEGDTAWRLISHLSLNYLSLLDHDAEQGAVALRELLALYAPLGEAAARRQIEGVRSVTSTPVTRRAPIPGPIAFARGLMISVTLDETAFEGASAFLLGAVLNEFFAKYVSINSFTETQVRAAERGEIKRWPVRIGRRQIL